MTSVHSEGLTGDPARQAVDSLKGYAYQVWQSLYRWLTLREDEILYLEGAEDLDILGPGRAETIQVKERRRSGSVTLQSEDLLKAIAHLWELQAQHSDLTIHFRFLTTAKRGRERRAAFGDQSGLDYWDLCKRPGPDLHPLRQFLQNQDILPESLRAFIISADDATLRDQLLARIEWDTGNEPKEFIEDLITRKVIHYGKQHYYLPPSESEKVVPHLLKHVWEVICRATERRLDYVDFMRLFERVTTERVNIHELRMLRQLSTAIGTSFMQGALGGLGPSPTIQMTGLQLSPPPLPEKVARRASLVATLMQRLMENGLVILQGSTGMGKSTLAALMVQTDPQGWTWLPMRGREPRQISELLYQAMLLSSDQTSRPRVVLDDLDIWDHPTVYEHALMGLLYAVLSRGGNIVVTTQGDMPSRITSRFQARDWAVNVPLFDGDDIHQLLRDHGCPSDELLAQWSVIIFTKTRGHPQLVHAYVRNVTARGWPQPGPDDMSQTTELETVRREARMRLQEQLPSEGARLLAYRLSLLGQPFRRDHVLHLGGHPPPLASPGEAFDLLLGPWVERVNEMYYQICPLLEGAAKDMWSAQQVADLQKGVAEALLVCQPLTLLEVSGMMRHGLASGAVTPVLASLAILKDAPIDAWPTIAQEFLWLPWIGLPAGERIFPANAFVSTMLRLFQFRIATEIDSETLAPLVADAWERELESIDVPTYKSQMRLIFLVLTLIRFQVPLSQRIVVARTAEVLRLLSDLPTLVGPHTPQGFCGDSAARRVIIFAVARCRQANDLDEFLSALAEQSDDTRHDILEPFRLEPLRADDYWANLLCGKVWLNEASTASPDWIRCIAVFERTITLGSAWGLNALVAAAYNALAVIRDEYLHDPEAALAYLAQGRAQLGESHPVLENARAMVLFRSRRYQEALRIWEAVLPHWPQGHDTSPAFAYRHASICAAEQGDWHKAADLALNGAGAADRARLMVMAAGLRADYAFALWKCGDAAKALTAFTEVLEVLATLPDPQQDLPTRALYVRVSYALMWMREECRGERSRPEPPIGCFSDPDLQESYRDQRLPAMLLLWGRLAQVEYEVQAGETIFHRLEVACEQSPLAEGEFVLANLRIRHHLKQLKVDLLMTDAAKFFTAAVRVRQGIEEGTVSGVSGLATPPGWQAIEDRALRTAFITDLLFAAVVLLISRNRREDAPIAVWKGQAGQLDADETTLAIWLDLFEQFSHQRYMDLVRSVRDAENHTKSTLAALFVSAAELADPEDRFYADILLAITVHDNVWRQDIEEAIATLVSRGWLRIASEQRFALRVPAVTAPAIRAACDSIARGLKKAANILLAAHNAVRLSVPEQVLQTLRELAGP